MAGIERFTRYAQRFLASDEGLLASVLGREENGRRRLVALATDRRLLLIQLRLEAPVSIPQAGLTIDVDEAERRLVFDHPNGRWVLTQVTDLYAARLIRDLVEDRRATPTRREAPPRIRILPAS